MTEIAVPGMTRPLLKANWSHRHQGVGRFVSNRLGPCPEEGDEISLLEHQAHCGENVICLLLRKHTKINTYPPPPPVCVRTLEKFAFVSSCATTSKHLSAERSVWVWNALGFTQHL